MVIPHHFYCNWCHTLQIILCLQIMLCLVSSVVSHFGALEEVAKGMHTSTERYCPCAVCVVLLKILTKATLLS